MQIQLAQAEKKGLRVGTFVSLTNKTTIKGFWKDHASGELRKRKIHEILELLSSWWEKKYMDRLFSAGETIFDTFITDLLSRSIKPLLALYLVFPRYLFNMGPSYMFSRVVETLRIDRHLTLNLLTQGKLRYFIF